MEEEELLQAVVLADSFTETFRPVTLETAKVLLPLVNVPMIEYTLEWLASQDVDEIFVFCCAHAEQVGAYLRGSRWHVVDGDDGDEDADAAAADADAIPSAAAFVGKDDVASMWKPVVRIVRSDICGSAGDALRELDAKGIIRSGASARPPAPAAATRAGERSSARSRPAPAPR